VSHRAPAVAASGEDFDAEDNRRVPAGEVHAWLPGTNQTVCGVPLARAGLRRFAHLAFSDALPESGGAADFVDRVCPRCRAATGTSAGRRRWTRRSPRP
jgi:hypothetical protein